MKLNHANSAAAKAARLICDVMKGGFKMIKKIKEFLINDQEIEAGSQRFLSLLFLLIAGLMSFFHIQTVAGFGIQH